MLPDPRAYAAADLRTGLCAEFERDVTEEDVLAFARNSGDWNPLHVDRGYAETTNYHGRIAHGALQVGLASALLGMHLPGRHVLLGSINARFVKPLYFPSRVRVRGQITSWNPSNRMGSLKVVIEDVKAGVPTADISLGFTLHQQTTARTAEPGAVARVGPVHAGERKAVLVTGVSGGIGAAIAADLARDHFIVGVVNRQPLQEPAAEHWCAIQADLTAPGWEGGIEEVLQGQPLYGVVHAAWPGAPHGGLLGTADDVLERQLVFGTTCAIRLGRLLHSRAGPDGGRLVALGSIAGTQKPVLTLAAYSLGKAALEQTVRLLAPELARKRITVNAVCPSFVPAGMHKQVSDHQRMKETALVPMGRLCLPGDIVGAVRFLLSPEAAFLSGQVIGLSGGQL